MLKGSINLEKILWVIAITLSIAVRIPSLSDKSYSWRPLQTEMTSYWFEKEGIDLLHYQTPIYGPPWQIPIEFPLFQATASVITKDGLIDLEFGSRLTALLFFYLSAGFLYLLCKKVFADHITTFVITNLYLWTPYNIYYSVIPLIDYLSVALSLAYLFYILSWLKSRSSVWNAFMAIIFGSLGLLVKPTTMPIVIVPIISFVVKDSILIFREDFSGSFKLRLLLNHIWSQRGYLLTLSIMAAIPLLLGSFWTYHADQIKSTSLFTQWLTSKVLQPWYFGTWELRANQDIWISYTDNALKYLLPCGLSIFAILGIFGVLGIIKAPKEKEEISLFIISVIVSIIVTFAVFLNLYLHQHYYIALSASMAILGGYGIRWFWRVRQELNPIFKYAFAVLTIIFFLGNVKDYDTYRTTAIDETRRREEAVAWGKKIQQYIPADNWVVVVEYGWDPVVPFLLERKAMVVTPMEKDKPICKMLHDQHFTVVVLTDPAFADNLKRALNCFKSNVEIIPGVYKVIH